MPDPYYGAAMASTRCSSSCTRPASGLLAHDPSRRGLPVSLPRGPASRDSRASAAATSTRPSGCALADGREAFVKTRAEPPPGEYAAEAARPALAGGARRAAHAARARARRALSGARVGRSPGALRRRRREELGRGLAVTHAAGRRGFGDSRRSTSRTLRLAGALQRADRRLAELLRRAAPAAAGAARARARRARRERRSRAVEQHVRADAELCGPRRAAGAPARRPVVGQRDGRTRDGRPWLIDPSAYGGHREMDLAMLRLFGAPSERVFDAYEEVAPLSEGWRERVELYQLLPLLVHALLFGGSYARLAPSAPRSATPAARAAQRDRGDRVPPARRSERGHAPRDRRVPPAAVPARAGGRGPPLPPGAHARDGGAARWRARRARFSAHTSSSARSPSRRICWRGAWPRRPSCWSSSARSRSRDVARLVGYRQAPHFARAFRRRYGLSPARFRERRSGEPGPRPAVLAGAPAERRRRVRAHAAASASAPGRRRRISVPPPGRARR